MKQSFLIIFSFLIVYSSAQRIDKKKQNNQKLKILLITEGTTYATTLIGLNSLWYKDYPRSSFHFIDDNGEWLQMDKLGHITTSYYMGVSGIKAYQWAGVSEKQAIWYGGFSGSFFLTAVEILDGFSKEWGASSGDLIANTMGSALCISQALYWNKQKIQLKYSYRPSKWADQNPELLGSNHIQRLIKDYNGQTYWISFNLKSLLNIKQVCFPEWLSLSVGYSGNKMVSAYHEDKKPDGSWNPKRTRQFLLSFDVDMTRVKTKSKVLNGILHTFGFLKFPMPTIELRNGKVFAHPLYY
tara:strand:- start:167 stop:1060 length:894 start_codon:yes stop_codon:yes gene_type:complete